MITMRPAGAPARSIGALMRCIGGGRGCEVGSYQGESAQLMLGSPTVTKLYCVDPWLSGYDMQDAASTSDMSQVERAFDERIGGDPRIVKCKGTLDDFAQMLSGARLDFVYVDANHQYGPCKHDLLLVKDIIKPRIIAGHDYYDSPKSWPGVKRAVDELFGEPDVRFPDSSWLVFLDSR